jgi:hypothetical protein
MSHPSGRYQLPFNFTVDHDQFPYNDQVQQLNVDTTQQTQQWPSQRPRSVQDLRNQAPSPTNSARSTRTTPNSRSSDRRLYHQAPHSTVNHGVGRNVASDSSFLSPDYRAYGYDPIARQMQEPSWSVYNPRSSNTSGARTPSRQSDMNYRGFPGPGSDVGSHLLPSDEGYFSQRTDQSVLSNEPSNVNQELPANIPTPLSNINVGSVTGEAPARSRLPSDQRSHVSQVSSRSGKSSRPTACTECGEISKCNSEHKYA